MTEQQIVNEIARLEHWAWIYSSVDRVRYDELQLKIRKLEMDLLEYMIAF